MRSALEIIKEENKRRLKMCHKSDSTGAMASKAKFLGYTIKNTCSASIALKLHSLEKDYQENKLIEKIGFKSNEKLGGIPTINFPNIYLQVSFMRLIKDNPQFMELESVKILMDYFEKHKVCLNCQHCNGLCYNNKFLYGKPDKAISELRVLLAYITEREELANKILTITKIHNVFRINGNGEIHSEDMLYFWINIAKRKKNTTFFTYTKSFELFENYLSHKKLPKNLIVNMSLIEGQQEKLSKFENLYSGNKFVIVKEIPDRAKYVCSGNCTQCGGYDSGYCMKKLSKSNNTIYVEYHN